jgi:hypothetical protein
MQETPIKAVHADIDQEESVAGEFLTLTHDIVVNISDGLTIHEDIASRDALAKLDLAAGEFHDLSVLDNAHTIFLDANVDCQFSMSL